MFKPVVLAALLALSAPPVLATTQGDVLVAEILPGWRTDHGTHIAALHLKLAPDWKTYWRAPGDTGIPPLFDWSGSENLGAVRVHWPRPHVFHVNGMQSIGYKTDLVLPIEVTAKDPTRAIHLRASIDLGVCRDICMPAELSLSAELAGPGAADAVISAALADRPDTPAEAGMAAIACKVEPIADGLRLTAEIDLPVTGTMETVVMEPGAAGVWASEAVVARVGRRLTASVDLVPESGEPFALDRAAVTLTVLGDDRAVEIPGCPAAP
ncbi:protein-disulfide reductase DsbD family protein [Paracoccaceae bacterium Fryx2]|nr:protein-disulfide reductase DsbD family protein [Paracoccaceae bacterium Fryx2]